MSGLCLSREVPENRTERQCARKPVPGRPRSAFSACAASAMALRVLPGYRDAMAAATWSARRPQRRRQTTSQADLARGPRPAIALSADKVREGQVLAGTQLRRSEDAAWPGSISAPLYQRLTAAAAAFADRYAPHLMSQASDPQLPTDTDHEA
jgi:hypothetical protein